MIHIRDLIHLIESIVVSWHPGIMNAAGPEIITIRKLASIIGERIGITPYFDNHCSPAATPLIADALLAKRRFGFEPMIWIDQGLRYLHDEFGPVAGRHS